jgi:hypothetical protein
MMPIGGVVSFPIQSSSVCVAYAPPHANAAVQRRACAGVSAATASITARAAPMLWVYMLWAWKRRSRSGATARPAKTNAPRQVAIQGCVARLAVAWPAVASGFSGERLAGAPAMSHPATSPATACPMGLGTKPTLSRSEKHSSGRCKSVQFCCHAVRAEIAIQSTAGESLCPRKMQILQRLTSSRRTIFA